MKKIEELIDAFNDDMQMGFIIGVVSTCIIFAVTTYGAN